MSKTVWALVALSIIAIVVGYTYVTVSNGPIAPLGRLSFVKILNPDMYPVKLRKLFGLKLQIAAFHKGH